MELSLRGWHFAFDGEVVTVGEYQGERRGAGEVFVEGVDPWVTAACNLKPLLEHFSSGATTVMEVQLSPLATLVALLRGHLNFEAVQGAAVTGALVTIDGVECAGLTFRVVLCTFPMGGHIEVRSPSRQLACVRGDGRVVI